MSALFPITARMSTIPQNALCSEQCWHSQHVSSLRSSLFSGKMHSHKRLHYLHQIHPALTDVLYRSKCPEASRLFVIQQSVSKDSWSWSSANYIWSQCHPKSADSLGGKLLWRVHHWSFPKFLLLLKATLQPSCTQAPLCMLFLTDRCHVCSLLLSLPQAFSVFSSAGSREQIQNYTLITV